MADNKMAVHFSSATEEWATPAAFFAKAAQLFNFTLDACATAENAKCKNHFDKQADGLAQCWHTAAAGGAVWVNPPYGRGIGAWVKKAAETALLGTPVVMLLPARTDTRWWQDHISRGGRWPTSCAAA